MNGLPINGRWDYGGFAYGLEPLVLPPVGTPDAENHDPTGVAGVGARAVDAMRIQTRGEPAIQVTGVERCDVPEDLYWFRWITGHQVCFVVWRLIAQLLDEVNRGWRSPYEVLEPLCRYVDSYSAMLLYTSSCPRDIYTVLIRPSMRRWHPAFSGSWAPDYWPIRDLFRGREPSAVWSADTGGLQEAIALLQTVHEGIAARLVADGRSLLRNATVRRPLHGTAETFYDTYFMTARAPVVRHQVLAQLTRRVVAIVQDIAANGLYTEDDEDERPTELQAAEVLRCEDRIADIMLEMARVAGEMTPTGLTGPLQSALRDTAAEV